MANGAELDSVKRGSGVRPLYAHPAFPALVAAWFAALFGGGSLMLPADLIGRLLTASGITAASLPLGFAARATMAIAGALAGSALGLSLARKVARAEKADPLGAQMPPRCRPIDVAADLGEEGIAETEWADPWAEKAPLDPGPAAATEQPTAQTNEPARPDGRASLDDLGLMQLTARLGASLNERRTRLAAKALPRQSPSVDPRTFEPSDAEEAARAIARFFAPVANDADGAEHGDGPVPAADSATATLPTSLAGLGQDNGGA